MSNLYDVLEVCLQDIDNGADIETVLFRYPEFAEDLRPILETSVAAKHIAVPNPSSEVIRRNRAKVLQHGAQLREAKAVPSYRSWTVPLRRALVTLAVIAALFISSTNLVRAASNTLPGDNLYPVKRTWEDVLVLFTFDIQARTALEIEHENERLDEVQELFAQGRSVEVDFAGTITRQDAGLWRVAGLRVVISPQTDVREPATVGDAVRVRGVTQADGSILAERVDLLEAGAPLPDVDDDDSDDEPEIEDGSSNNENESGEDNSGPGSGNEAPEVEETETLESDSIDDNSSGGDNSGSGDGNSNDNSNENESDDDNGSGGDNDNDSNDNENDSSGGGGDDDD